MKRRLLCFFLALTAALSAFSLTAYAEEGNIFIGGTVVTEENADDVFGDGTVSYDAATNTLTLDGAEITGAPMDGAYCGIAVKKTPQPLNVYVKSDSRIVSPDFGETIPDDLCLIGIFSEGSLVFSEGETLSVVLKQCSTARGIAAGGSITLEKNKLYVDAANATENGIGVFAADSLNLNESAARIYGTTAAVDAAGSLNFLGGTVYMGALEDGTVYQYLISYPTVYHKVIWKNYDGTVLETDAAVAHGTAAEYNGKTPQRPNDSTYTYTFTGWDGDTVAVLDDTVFTAQYAKKRLISPEDERHPDADDTDREIRDADTDKSELPGASFLPLMLKATGKSKKITLQWKRVKGAESYRIYGAPCGKKMKLLKTVKKGTQKYTFKKLKKNRYYKYTVVACKSTAKGEKAIAKSSVVHCKTNGGKKGNPTGISVAKTKLTVKKGKSKTLRPTLEYDKRPARHTATFRYESADPTVVSVSENGKIKAKKKGTAAVYIYTQNGVYKKISITVK